MYWDVKLVKPLPDHRIYVEVEDGRKGVFDLKPYLDFGVFRELKNEHYFNQVGIQFGAVTWPHEQDIAPETLLAGLQISESDVVGLKAAETPADYSSDKPRKI
ncbi:MAG: DUF2442 domain-containing protein [Gammaproteobacteria bacterium]|nr:DUF2442 domain-containing protein [Gammaproteobacteria bacterium]MBU1775855.1 DUF2442 domain-containing protein [Gammaproteobacteria bacterium]